VFILGENERDSNGQIYVLILRSTQPALQLVLGALPSWQRFRT